VGQGAPVESSTDLPITLVQYVARTREVIVLSDAGHAKRFTTDPYIADHRPASVLCMPLTRRSRLIGVLYLENRSAHDAFTQDRVEILGLLCSQAAIAVENALLYGHLNEVTEQLRHANLDLNKANELLTAELSDRERAEESRLALKEEVIRLQETRLSELSTPLIPITNEIMVMPLIGSIDGHRAEQILQTGLLGAQRNGAQIVIIDITGMRQVDASAATSLIRTASALRLLGAQAVLTGIRPEVAEMLVRLDVDLGSIVTRGTLQSGFEYALRQVGHGQSLRGEGNWSKPRARR